MSASDIGAVRAGRLPRPPVWKLLPLRRIKQGDFSGLLRLLEHYPDGFEQRLPSGRRVIFLNHPDLIEALLVKNHKEYHRDRGSMGLNRVMGQGVLTSEDECHLLQRRLIQPAFHKKRVDDYADTMVSLALAECARWNADEPMDLNARMMAVTLAIITRTMFSSEVEQDVETVAEALDLLLRHIDRYLVPGLGKLLDRLPLKSTRQINEAIATLDQIVYRFIREHREGDEDTGDLLSMLLSAQYEDGSHMSDLQVRDEAITLFLAGHETTAVALSWTFYLLSRHPFVVKRLQTELDMVLEGGRPPTAADLPHLDYTRRVLTESMRVFPPVPGFGREAITDNYLGMLRVRKGDVVMVSQMATHHSPRWFPEPHRFDPDRWLPERCAGLPKFAYFPFGGGIRKCIGEPFAWMEGVLLLATFAQHWRFELAPDARVEQQATVTLRPKYGLRMIGHRRVPTTSGAVYGTVHRQ